MEAMKGSEGSTVELTVRHNGVDTNYTFTRRSIEVVSVTGSLVDGYIGYIKIDGFKQNTPEQFVETLQRLTSNGAEALLFDVRDTSEGVIDSVQECLDPLLPEGIIATAEYKDGHTETIVYSDESAIKLPMAVLVNKNTSNVAELFAAALKDVNGAQLIGIKTSGNGSLQEITDFENGGAVKLTVAEIKTASEKSYNKVGLSPDVVVENENENVDSQYNKAIESLTLTLNGQ